MLFIRHAAGLSLQLWINWARLEGAEGKRLASKNVWVSLLKTIAYWRAECYCSTRFFFPLHLAQASSGGNCELLCFRWHTYVLCHKDGVLSLQAPESSDTAFFLPRAPFPTLFLLPTFLLCQSLSPPSAHASISNQFPSLMTCLLVTTLVRLPRFVQIIFCSRYTTSTIALGVE